MNKIQSGMNRLHNQELGTLLVRIALGVVFISAGWMKINNLGMIVGYFSSLGLAAFWAYLVSYVEFIGGIAIVLGIFVRYIGLAFTVIMAVAIIKVHWVNGFDPQNNGYEYVLVTMLIALAAVFLGDGGYSLRRLFRRDN